MKQYQHKLFMKYNIYLCTSKINLNEIKSIAPYYGILIKFFFMTTLEMPDFNCSWLAIINNVNHNQIIVRYGNTYVITTMNLYIKYI
jgi:hypothetical protein